MSSCLLGGERDCEVRSISSRPSRSYAWSLRGSLSQRGLGAFVGRRIEEETKRKSRVLPVGSRLRKATLPSQPDSCYALREGASSIGFTANRACCDLAVLCHKRQIGGGYRLVWSTRVPSSHGFRSAMNGVSPRRSRSSKNARVVRVAAAVVPTDRNPARS